eukprot:c10132_g2_i1.p1 GENE.c10132_g2_i1~~c10132_g2_i1.p1  ORF type:complete len:344 (+),score=97.57 c10132_g2_i1:23-1033(+)
MVLMFPQQQYIPQQQDFQQQQDTTSSSSATNSLLVQSSAEASNGISSGGTSNEKAYVCEEISSAAGDKPKYAVNAHVIEPGQFESSYPWTRGVLWDLEARLTLARAMVNPDATSTPFPLDVIRGLLIALGATPPPRHSFTVDHVHDHVLMLLFSAFEYRDRFAVQFGGWPYANEHTWYRVRGADEQRVNTEVFRVSGNVVAAHSQELLRTFSQPKIPVVLLCSEYDVVVPCFHAVAYANASSKASNVPVRVLKSHSYGHLVFTSSDIDGAMDTLFGLMHDEIQGAESPLTSREWDVHSEKTRSDPAAGEAVLFTRASTHLVWVHARASALRKKFTN